MARIHAAADAGTSVGATAPARRQPGAGGKQTAHVSPMMAI